MSAMRWRQSASSRLLTMRMVTMALSTAPMPDRKAPTAAQSMGMGLGEPEGLAWCDVGRVAEPVELGYLGPPAGISQLPGSDV